MIVFSLIFGNDTSVSGVKEILIDLVLFLFLFLFIGTLLGAFWIFINYSLVLVMFSLQIRVLAMLLDF